ncbi:MAG TPA: tRNA (adenosine(37)-N6)-threonylcarbamoyltransferase complex transferase subunit TsaD [Patescibacteria group bacterium]|jgi:N6-L-threonylcarbamoyladenine synthase|nr:tRNA (adenosine(37)-N6)-threonylcarbamoyltransferase complex transferase subunit TsaD [Patescibacteria group bacterium]
MKSALNSKLLIKSRKTVNILAIETSCDETAASVLRGDVKAKQPKFKFLSSVVKSQIDIHKRTGGVVPEVAAREHMVNILPVTEKALHDAKLSLDEIDYVAVTSGPGLVVALIVGTEFAKGLSLASGTPLLPTNHMEGHLYSAFAEHPEKVQFPVLCIIVSGGHTMFVLLKDYKHYKVIGNTVDDAAGEAFDKVARLLNLPYPGGPEISKLAQLGKTDIKFPRPMIGDKNFDFSFSGLKTAVLYYIDKLVAGQKTKRALSKQQKADIAMSFENAVADVITKKALRAVEKYNCKTVALSGGVAANKKLRADLAKMCKENKVNFTVPDFELCTDNAQMIALAAYFNLRAGKKPAASGKVKANPAWEIH